MNKLLERAHRLYDLESDYLEKLLKEDPTFRELKERVAVLEARVARSPRPRQEDLRALREARESLVGLTREMSFKLGYLFAHHYPLEDIAALF